jgi:hypothetical protein
MRDKLGAAETYPAALDPDSAALNQAAFVLKRLLGALALRFTAS